MYAYDADTGRPLSAEDTDAALDNPLMYRWVRFSDVPLGATA